MEIKTQLETEEDRRCAFFNKAEELGMSISDAKLLYNAANGVINQYGKKFLMRLIEDENFSSGIEGGISYIQGLQFILDNYKPIQTVMIKPELFTHKEA